MTITPRISYYGFSASGCVTVNDVARVKRERDIAMEWIWTLVESLEQIADLREENGATLAEAKEVAEDILLRVTEHYKPTRMSNE